MAILAILAVLAVPLTTLTQGDQSGIEEARQVVVRTSEEWKKLWQQHAPGEKMPPVDFSKSMVIGVFLGARNTGGYRVTIAGAEREGSDLVVTWREDRPAARDIVTQVLTFPHHLVRLELTAGEVKFRRID